MRFPSLGKLHLEMMYRFTFILGIIRCLRSPATVEICEQPRTLTSVKVEMDREQNIERDIQDQNPYEERCVYEVFQ